MARGIREELALNTRCSKLFQKEEIITVEIIMLFTVR